MKSNLQAIELPTGGPRLGASISANEQKKSRKKVSKLKEPRQVKLYVKLYNLYRYILLFLLLSHFSFFFVLFFFFTSYFCVEGRGRSFLFILCSKSWRIYEALLCLWGHCLHRFFSLLKTISRLKLTSIPANSGYVQSFLWVNRKKKMVNIVLGHIINT